MNLKDNNSGLSLLLAVLILSGFIMVGLAASDLVLRVGRSSQKIVTSEVAYYAAESAAEIALYRVEKDNYGVAGLDGSGSLDNNAGWSRSVYVYATTTYTTDPGTPNQIWTDSPGEITNSNPLKVRLEDTRSFELELNINGATYPSDSMDPDLRVEWSDSGSEVIIYNQSNQTQITTNETLLAIIEDLETDFYIIRIVNNSGATVTYTLRPANDGNALPIGIIISTTGTYLDQERRLELVSKRWQIY